MVVAKSELSTKLEDLQDEIEGLEWENEGLQDEINHLYSQIDDIYRGFRELGLRDPDTYSLAELSEIKAAIERITSPITVR